MRGSRIIGCVAAPLSLAVALALLCFVRSPQISASLYDLIGSEVDRIPKFLREASSSEAALIVSSVDASKANEVAEGLSRLVGPCSGGDFPKEIVDFIRANRGGLVTPETASLLKTESGRAILAKRAMRRLYLSPIQPILGFEDDPFGLTDAFLLSLSGASRIPGRSFPEVHTNGVTRLMVRTRLDIRSLDETIASVKTLRQSVERCRAPGVDILLAGAPVHAALSAERCKTEISLLTWFSLAFIAVLALVVFRSWKWIPILAGSLAVSALSGAIALVVLFRNLHVMTFVMGTTVLGLVIDYSFHWLLSAEREKCAVRRNLFVSFLTTEISLFPLMLSTIPVLRQSAIFLGVGLFSALVYVLTCYPKSDDVAPRESAERSRVAHWFSLAFFPALILTCGACLGIGRGAVRTELTALYRPSPELQEAERQRASFGVFDFSKIPDLSTRNRIAADVERLYLEQGGEMAKALQLPSLRPPPSPTHAILQPQALVERIFAAWTSDALKRLGLSIVVLLLVVTILCRRQALRVCFPPLLSIFFVAGILSWFGVSINLFHLLAMFLLMGMGVDYAVFLQSGSESVFRPALSSLLTSLAGFGALAFVSFPVVASFGIVLGIGLPVSFILACPRERAFVEKTEKAASPLGLEILWILYRFFGLRLLHFVASTVGLVVWCFSSSVRRASPNLLKVIGFTQSLADKLVIMAEGSQLPRVEVENTEEAATFLAEVKSGKGVFILSSHIGTIEALIALGACNHTFHAWMDFDRTGVFNRFYLRHARRRRVVIHPISSFGIETVFEAGAFIDSGDCLVMAGDRGDGAFRFAAAFDHPVYFVACVAIRPGRYRAIVRRLPESRVEIKVRYEKILHELSETYPNQHFAWST